MIQLYVMNVYTPHKALAPKASLHFSSEDVYFLTTRIGHHLISLPGFLKDRLSKQDNVMEALTL